MMKRVKEMWQGMTARTATSAAIVVVAAAAVAAWMLVSGDVYDDEYYRHTFPVVTTDYLTWDNAANAATSPRVSTVGDVVESYVNHCRYWNNGRLANGLTYASSLVPAWVTDLLHGVMTGAMIALMMLLGAGRRWMRHPGLTALAAMVTLGLWPWNDLWGSSCFVFNYVWSMTAVLLTMAMVYAWRPAAWVIAATGFVAGMMHEGIAAPAVAGMVAGLPTVWGDRRRRKAVLTGAAAMGAGVVALMAMPSFANRLIDARQPTEYVIEIVKLYVAPLWWAIVAAAVVAVSVAVRRPAGVKAALRASVKYVVMAAAAIWLFRQGREMPRVMWAGLAALTVMTVMWVKVVTQRRRNARAGVTAGIVAAVALAAWGVDLTVTQARLTAEKARLDAMIDSEENRRVYFCDATGVDMRHWWLNDFAAGVFNRNRDIDAGHHRIIEPECKLPVVILPEALRGTDLRELPPVAGNAGWRGCHPYYLADRDLGAGVSMWVTYTDMDDIPAGVSTSPMRLYRLLWNPKWVADTVRVAMVFYSAPALDEKGDTLHFYLHDPSKSSLVGMRPIQIDTMP